VDGLEGYHDFFVASAGVAGALIGLLFVALSVARTPETDADRYAHRYRGASALTAFTNALVVSLFLLMPHVDAGYPVLSVALVGVGFVLRSARELRAARADHHPTWQDVWSLTALLVVFGVQASAGLRFLSDEHATAPIDTVSILIVVCYLIGIARAWEMIGGPRMAWRD
jgi:hypothetical protein